MKLGSMKTAVAAAGLLACLVSTAIVKAQAPAEKPLLSDQVTVTSPVVKSVTRR